MFKNLFILFFSVFLLFSCSKKGEEKEEISKEDYLINTFMKEYIAAQSQN